MGRSEPAGGVHGTAQGKAGPACERSATRAARATCTSNANSGPLCPHPASQTHLAPRTLLCGHLAPLCSRSRRLYRFARRCLALGLIHLPCQVALLGVQLLSLALQPVVDGEVERCGVCVRSGAIGWVQKAFGQLAHLCSAGMWSIRHPCTPRQAKRPPSTVATFAPCHHPRPHLRFSAALRSRSRRSRARTSAALISTNLRSMPALRSRAA